MPLRPAIFSVLLLAGCATHTEPPAPVAQKAPASEVANAPAPPAGKPGVILAMRPVLAESRGPARVVLAGLGSPGELTADHLYEFIVRTENGTTISIVQPRTSDLHTGEHVRILRGTETRIDVPASD